MTDRERLHVLVDALPDVEMLAALRFVEQLAKSLPSVDEPVAEDEDAKHGRIISHEGMHRRIFGKD